LNILQILAGDACGGGITVYYMTKMAARILNLTRRNRRLKQDTIDLMQPLFPNLDLKRVRLNINAELPGEWYNPNVSAMTFGYKIIFNRSNIQNKYKTDESLMLLMHELVHVDQMRRLSETGFACAYGVGFVNAGFNYDNIPLEIEAKEFVKANPIKNLKLVSPPSNTLTAKSNQIVTNTLLLS